MTLPLEFLARDVEPSLDPFPPTQPANGKGGEAPEPVAQGADKKARKRRAACEEDTGIESVGRERNDGGCQEGAQKEA